MVKKSKQNWELKWDNLLKYINDKFGDEKYLGLQAVLYLIGVNELGQGLKEFSKEDKLNLIHIAICKLLSEHGYYDFDFIDEEGWPHWKTNKDVPKLSLEKQDLLIKKSAVKYFTDSGVEF